ncbi:MAG: hypothetical protein ABUR63_03615, partial [Verrucomicrobiota bacterium]
ENPIPANLGSHWVESVFNIGNRGHRRVFVKMALELLARYDAAAARDGALGSARQFARLDRGEISFKPDAASEGSGLLAKTRTRFRIGHSVEVWTCGQNVLVKVAFFGKLIFTASLSSAWNSSPFSVAHILDPQDPSVALTRNSKRAGKPLTLWHEGMAKPAIEAFEAHVEAVAYEKGVAAAATPISRDPGPVLDAAMIARITAAFDRIVSKRGTRPARKAIQELAEHKSLKVTLLYLAPDRDGAAGHDAPARTAGRQQGRERSRQRQRRRRSYGTIVAL